nr:hypothetical protein [Oceanicoccus sagamiensis]
MYLHRDPRENISSIIEAWEQGEKNGKFITFRNLPDWPMPHWCLLLPRGWRNMKGRSLAEIAGFQWQSCNDAILNELEKISSKKWTTISHQELTSNTKATVTQLSNFIGNHIDEHFDEYISHELPLSSTTITAPKKDKWMRHKNEIEALLPGLQKTTDRINAL